MARSASLSIEVTGDVKRLQKAFRVLAETDAPYLRPALEESGEELGAAASSGGTGGIGSAVQFAGVKGKGGTLSATIVVDHPGAKAMEFGRTKYYRGFKGRKQKSGSAFKASPGQKAKPFIGIVTGDGAIGVVGPRIRERLSEAVANEWARIAEGGE